VSEKGKRKDKSCQGEEKILPCARIEGKRKNQWPRQTSTIFCITEEGGGSKDQCLTFEGVRIRKEVQTTNMGRTPVAQQMHHQTNVLELQLQVPSGLGEMMGGRKKRKEGATAWYGQVWQK